MVVAVTLLGAVGLLGAARLRARFLRPIQEALATRTIGELSAGRFRVTGRIVPIRTVPSRIDESPCVFVEHAEYRTLGSTIVPLLREVEHTTVAHPFYLEDESGRLLVDPGRAAIEAVTVLEDEGLSAERRLRAGEEIELVATFAPRDAEADGGPYRASAVTWTPVDDVCGPPRLSYRTEPGMVQPADDFTSFLHGAGVLLAFMSVLFGVLSLL